jgi:hypothetical protein
MARAAREDDDDVPPPPGYQAPPDQWDNPQTAREVQSILDGLEIAEIDHQTRMMLQLWQWRSWRLAMIDPKMTAPAHGRIVMVLRCITESTGNEGSLCKPVLSAVSSAIRPWEDRGLELVEAFDQIGLTQLRAALTGLDLLDEREISLLLERAIHRRLAKILDKPEPVKPPKPSKRELREQAAAKLAAKNMKAIALGRQLLELKARTDNREFGRQRNQLGVDSTSGSHLMAVARLYAGRPEIFGATRWSTLCALASPSLPEVARKSLERRIVAGERVGPSDVRTARGKLPSGRPKAARVAA